MMLRVEGMGITSWWVRDLQSEEGLLKAASWKEAGPGVGKGGDGIAPSGRGEFCSATHISRGGRNVGDVACVFVEPR